MEEDPISVQPRSQGLSPPRRGRASEEKSPGNEVDQCNDFQWLTVVDAIRTTVVRNRKVSPRIDPRWEHSEFFRVFPSHHRKVTSVYIALYT